MPSTRHLAAIVFADLESYSFHINRNEAATIAFMERSFVRARRASERLGGEIVGTTGDGWIALFSSASSAVDFAHLMQRLTVRREPSAPSLFRIGVHLGDVNREGAHVYGHAMNVAARLEAIAEAGGIVVSETVAGQVARSPRYSLHKIGQPFLKNIGDDLTIYQVRERAEARPAPTRLQLDVVGGVSLRMKSGTVIALRSKHGQAMLGALALAPLEPIEANRLAVMLWPSKTPKKAREALAALRRAVNAQSAFASPALVQADGRSMRLDLAAVDIDLQGIDRQLSEGRVAPVLFRHLNLTESLLEGLDDVSPLFSTWLRVHRAMWRDRIVSGLEACLDRSADGQPTQKAAAEALLLLEPGHEPASHALMRNFAAHGRTEAALREYDRLLTHLHEAYRARPGEALRTLATALRGQTRPTSDPVPVRVAPRLPHIAVAAFHSGSEEARNVSERFRSELLANLSRFRMWAVLDAADVEPGEASYVVSAHCEVSDGTAHLTLRLTHLPSRRIAWSDTYAVSADAWRQVQAVVVGRVAAALEIYISADRLSGSIGGVPTDTQDYDDWLRGEALLLRWSAEAEDEAAAIFASLIERSPSFAPPRASLASVLNVRHILRPGSRRSAADIRLARSHASLAVTLDPLDARNHLALAWSAALEGAHDEAGLHLDMATSLNPYSPNTTISAAMGYAFLGDHARAEKVLDDALKLTPMLRSHHWCYAAAVRFLGGDSAAAIAASLRSGDQIADNQGWLAAALARQGRMDEARVAFDRLVSTLTPLWDSETPPDAEDVHAWFVSAYPIRRDEDLALLSGSLRLAMPPVTAAVLDDGGR